MTGLHFVEPDEPDTDDAVDNVDVLYAEPVMDGREVCPHRISDQGGSQEEEFCIKEKPQIELRPKREVACVDGKHTIDTDDYLFHAKQQIKTLRRLRRLRKIKRRQIAQELQTREQQQNIEPSKPS